MPTTGHKAIVHNRATSHSQTQAQKAIANAGPQTHVDTRVFIHIPISVPACSYTCPLTYPDTCLYTCRYMCPHTCPHLRARTYLLVTVAYGTCTMSIWLTTTCPKTLIVTLGDVLESGNAKSRINLTRSICARCGDEVL